MPIDIDKNAIIDCFLQIDGVASNHPTHSWSLDREHHGLTADLVVAKDPNTNQIMGIKNKQDKQLSI